MLTVYSAHGSPGASTTAMYLAAQWASTGTEVLLVEADPGGGSLSHHLGIQFTPGSASFVASGLPVRSGNLIDHSQDVLFNSLHVMPATSSPTGAREIVRWWNERAGELRDISESEMAVIVDAGRITADSVAADLAAHAAGVLVVAGGDSSQSSREHIGSLLSAEACGDGVERGVVTVGDSPLSAEEWREKCDLTFYGSIMEFAEITGDLSAFLNRNKRKSKKWRVSLEEVAEKLLPYAKPVSGASRAERLAPATETPPVPQAPPAPSPAPAAASPPPAAADEPQEHEPEHEPELHDGVPPTGAYGQLMPQPDPYYATPAEVYGQATPPPDDRYNPPAPLYAAPPPAPTYQQHPAEQQPMYFESPPAPPEHQYYDAPLPVYQPPPAGHEQPQPQRSGYQVPPELLEVYQQHGVAPSWAPSAQEPPPYQQQAYEPQPELPPPYQQQAYQPQPEPPPQYQQQPQQPQQPQHEAPQYQQQAHQPQPSQHEAQRYQQQPQQPQHEAQRYQQQPQQPQQPQHEAQRYQQQPQQPQQPQHEAPAYQHATQHPYQQPQQPQPPQSTAHHPQAHQPAYGHTPSPQPASHAAPSAAAPAGSPPTPAGAQPPPLPDMAPSGSFRDWANRMHAQAPQGTSNSGHGGGS